MCWRLGASPWNSTCESDGVAYNKKPDNDDNLEASGGLETLGPSPLDDICQATDVFLPGRALGVHGKL